MEILVVDAVDPMLVAVRKLDVLDMRIVAQLPLVYERDDPILGTQGTGAQKSEAIFQDRERPARYEVYRGDDDRFFRCHDLKKRVVLNLKHNFKVYRIM